MIQGEGKLETSLKYDTYSEIQNKPFKSYRKTIVGKVYVSVFNSITRNPEGLLLEGPNDQAKACIDVWNEQEDLYFRRNNRRALETGRIIEFVKSDDFEELKPEYLATASDEQLEEIVMSRYYKLLSELNKITSESVLLRLLEIARKKERSEKYIDAITAKLSELQESDQDLEE